MIDLDKMRGRLEDTEENKMWWRGPEAFLDIIALCDELRDARQKIEEMKAQLDANNLVISHLLTKYSLKNGG